MSGTERREGWVGDQLDNFRGKYRRDGDGSETENLPGAAQLALGHVATLAVEAHPADFWVILARAKDCTSALTLLNPPTNKTVAMLTLPVDHGPTLSGSKNGSIHSRKHRSNTLYHPTRGHFSPPESPLYPKRSYPQQKASIMGLPV